VLLAMFLFVDASSFASSPGAAAAVTLPMLAGAAAFRAGFAERARERGGTTRAARGARRPTSAPPPPLGPPPRIGDDPFRDPPGRPPIVVERHPRAPITAPIVPGDPSDRPKLLS
jgi:hypothetical protein